MEEYREVDNEEQESNDEEDQHGVTSIITADEILKIGLKVVGYKKHWIRRVKQTTNVDRFKAHSGLSQSTLFGPRQALESLERRFPINLSVDK